MAMAKPKDLLTVQTEFNVEAPFDIWKPVADTAYSAIFRCMGKSRVEAVVVIKKAVEKLDGVGVTVGCTPKNSITVTAWIEK